MATFWMILFGVGVYTIADIPSSMVISPFKSMRYSGNIPDPPLNEGPFIRVLFPLVLTVIPPLTKELIFRSVILSGLCQSGDTATIFGSAFLFALYHGSFAQMVFAFPCDLALAPAVVRAGNLWAAALIRFINNKTSILFRLSQFYADQATALTAYTTYFIGPALVGTGVLILLSRRSKSLFRLDSYNFAPSTSQKFVTTLWNPDAVVLILLSLTSAVYILEIYWHDKSGTR